MPLAEQQTEEERIPQKAREDVVLLSELSGCNFYSNNDGDIIVRDLNKLIALLKRIRRNDRLCHWVLNYNIEDK
jgi:hypothetical protein